MLSSSQACGWASSRHCLRSLDGPVRATILCGYPIFAACYSADLGGAVGAAGGKWVYSDVGMGSEPDTLECSVRVDFPDGKRISISADPTRRTVWIRDQTREFAPALRDGGAAAFELEPEYRNEVVTIVHEDQTYQAVEAIAEFVREGRMLKAGRGAAPA